MASSSSLIVVITGASSQIGNRLTSMVASGSVFGKDQNIILKLLDDRSAMSALEGLVMELCDCAFPRLKKIVQTSDPFIAFRDADVAFLVGASPLVEGMIKMDHLKKNIDVFKVQGMAIDQASKKTIKVLVIGDPSNTNATICAHYAPSIPKENFSALTRLDHNIALNQIAVRTGVDVEDVKNVIIWGSHSPTQFPDASFAFADGWPVRALIKDPAWFKSAFISNVKNRQVAILNTSQVASAMSVAKAACDHLRCWWHGTPNGEWVSMAVMSDGKSYGVPPGVMFSFPVIVNRNREWKIVNGLELTEFGKRKFQEVLEEVVSENAEIMRILMK